MSFILYQLISYISWISSVYTWSRRHHVWYVTTSAIHIHSTTSCPCSTTSSSSQGTSDAYGGATLKSGSSTTENISWVYSEEDFFSINGGTYQCIHTELDLICIHFPSMMDLKWIFSNVKNNSPSLAVLFSHLHSHIWSWRTVSDINQDLKWIFIMSENGKGCSS